MNKVLTKRGGDQFVANAANRSSEMKTKNRALNLKEGSYKHLVKGSLEDG